MASLDDVFKKSDITENKRLSKKVFGQLLINMRNNNHIRLYSLLGEVGDTDIVEDTLIVSFLDKTSYEMVNNQTDIDTLANALHSIGHNYKIKLLCTAKQQLNVHQFEEFLKQEFGKILTIK